MLHSAIAILAFFVPFMAIAHGGTPSFEKEVDGYLVDIGYDRVGIRPGEEVTFDFDLFTQSGAVSFAHFTHVAIEVAKEGITVADATLENDAVNVPVWKYVFPEDGDYVLHVTYKDADEVMAYATFDVSVGEGNGAIGRAANTATYVVAGVLAALSAVVIATSLMRRKG